MLGIFPMSGTFAPTHNLEAFEAIIRLCMKRIWAMRCNFPVDIVKPVVLMVL